MNDFYEPQNEFENEITISKEDIKSHKSIFSKLCFALLIYLVAVEGSSLVLGLAINSFYPSLLKNTTALLIFSFFCAVCNSFSDFLSRD